jgi:flavin reductase (DIM6/NTAB) family NADH-FMN oxidoreductase RutF
MRKALDPAAIASVAFERLNDGGLLISCVGRDGRANLITVSWWLFGWFYHASPVSVIAIRRDRFSYHLLEEVPEFVVAVPGRELRQAVDYCGSHSGANGDKFAATGLTAIPSYHVRPPSVAECLANYECRIYEAVHPPHLLLTPEHRLQPLQRQHTIYFAEVLGVYAGTT